MHNFSIIPIDFSTRFPKAPDSRNLEIIKYINFLFMEFYNNSIITLVSSNLFFILIRYNILYK